MILNREEIMSYQNFEKALELAKQCRFYTIKGEWTNEVVTKAEELFGLKFSKQNFEFFKSLGYLSFAGNEFYGICKDDFSGTYACCAIEATLQDRTKLNLPPKWLTLYFFDDGYYGYLDYSQLNEDGEPPVIMAIYNGQEYVVIEKIAEDFGDFLLKLVEEQLERQ
jgi:hypothetical protein